VATLSRLANSDGIAMISAGVSPRALFIEQRFSKNLLMQRRAMCQT
jgi:hypothetical protein